MLLPLLANASLGTWESVSARVAVYSALFTILAGIAAAVWAMVIWRREAIWRREDHAADRKQREQELRWKQAELAKQLLDEIFDHRPSDDACRMVDAEEMFEDAKGNQFRVDMDLVRHALPTPWNDECGGPDVYVRSCFDALFYYFERLEHFVRIELVNFEDLNAPTAYYVALMARDKKLFQEYAKLIRFDRAIAFMYRFPEWEKAAA